ncbi:uncharacterized protein ACIQIH_013555 isoform 1-T1 [Cyanocitta cristata]
MVCKVPAGDSSSGYPPCLRKLSVLGRRKPAEDCGERQSQLCMGRPHPRIGSKETGNVPVLKAISTWGDGMLCQVAAGCASGRATQPTHWSSPGDLHWNKVLPCCNATASGVKHFWSTPAQKQIRSVS